MTYVDHSTGIVMPNGVMIAATTYRRFAYSPIWFYNGVEITYADGTKRWFSNEMYDDRPEFEGIPYEAI